MLLLTLNRERRNAERWREPPQKKIRRSI